MILNNANLIKHNGAEVSLIKLNGTIVYEKPKKNYEDYYVEYTVDNSKTLPLNSEDSNGLPYMGCGDGNSGITSYRKIEITLNNGTTTTDITTTCNNIKKVKVWWDPEITKSISFMQGVTKVVKTLEYVHSPESFSSDPYPFFKNDSTITRINASNWSIKRTSLSRLFENFSSLEEVIGISSWDVSNVTNMSSMFEGCSSLSNLDLTGWNVSNVKNMNNMFENCYALRKVYFDGWDPYSVTGMNKMFSGCGSLTSLDLTNWNTKNVTSLICMFQDCYSLKALTLNGWRTANVTSMGEMFRGCESLSSLGLDGWDISRATDVDFLLFSNCDSLGKVTIAGWTYSDTNTLIEALPKGTLINGTPRVLYGNETVLHEIEEPGGWVFQYV